jgi:pyridoxine kinase
MARAVETLHDTYGVPHIVITSVQLPAADVPAGHMCVIGSSSKRTPDAAAVGRRARIFRIVFPAIDVYFSGTGDMFAALTVVRMREAVELQSRAAGDGARLLDQRAWLSADDVAPTDLPLARAVEKVLGSMHQVLEATQAAMERERGSSVLADGQDKGDNGSTTTPEDAAKREKSASSRAAELRLVRNTRFLKNPAVVYRAEALEV